MLLAVRHHNRTSAHKQGARWWQAGFFYLALAMGPLFWGTYAWLSGDRVDGFAFGTTYFVFVVLYPIAEEILFRGVVQASLLEAGYLKLGNLGLSGANLVTSALFALCHFTLNPTAWSVLVFFPSLLFGHLYERYRTVVPCIVVHCFYNAGFFLLWPITQG